MAELLATPPLDMVPLTLGAATLALADPGPITCVALYPGGQAAAEAALGAAFPAPGRVVVAGEGRLVWSGRDQAFLVGAAPPAELAKVAAVTDQSDGWAALVLQGAGAEHVLARLVALDLRAAAFAPGQAARVGLNHVPAVMERGDDGRFILLVFRSMARTAWTELSLAMTHVAARAALAARE